MKNDLAHRTRTANTLKNMASLRLFKQEAEETQRFWKRTVLARQSQRYKTADGRWRAVDSDLPDTMTLSSLAGSSTDPTPVKEPAPKSLTRGMRLRDLAIIGTKFVNALAAKTSTTKKHAGHGENVAIRRLGSQARSHGLDKLKHSTETVSELILVKPWPPVGNVDSDSDSGAEKPIAMADRKGGEGPAFDQKEDMGWKCTYRRTEPEKPNVKAIINKLQRKTDWFKNQLNMIPDAGRVHKQVYMNSHSEDTKGKRKAFAEKMRAERNRAKAAA